MENIHTYRTRVVEAVACVVQVKTDQELVPNEVLISKRKGIFIKFLQVQVAEASTGQKIEFFNKSTKKGLETKFEFLIENGVQTDLMFLFVQS